MSVTGVAIDMEEVARKMARRFGGWIGRCDDGRVSFRNLKGWYTIRWLTEPDGLKRVPGRFVLELVPDSEASESLTRQISSDLRF